MDAKITDITKNWLRHASERLRHRKVMESLPLEVVVEVVRYLAPRDLAMCCAVSSQWQHLFGSDEVWKPRCDRELEEHLITTPCVVKPAFSLPQGRDSTLDPVSRWRAAFLREQHLRRNLRQGNRVEVEKDIDDLSRGLQFVSNDRLVYFYRNRIKLWNVRTVPPTIVAVTNLHHNISREFWVEFEKKRSLIFLTHVNFVVVVKVDLMEDRVGVKQMFVFDETVKVPEDLCSQSKCSKRCALDVYKKAHFPVTDLGIKSCTVTGNFLGYNAVDDNNVIHIWDSENGVKLKEEPCPLSEDGFQIFAFSNSASSDDVLVITNKYTDGGDCVCYFVCNVKQLNFLSFQERISPFDHYKFYPAGNIVDGYVGLCFPQNLLQIFNYRTSQMLYTFDKISLCTVCNIDGGFLFTSDVTLLAVFPEQDVIKNIVDFDSKTFSCHGHNIVSISPIEANSKELWKVDRLYSLKIDIPYSWLYANEACTRALYVREKNKNKPIYYHNIDDGEEGSSIIYFW